MVVYENPDFLNLPPGATRLFAKAGEESFFSLPGWYDLMARYGVAGGRQVLLCLDDAELSRAALLCENDPADEEGRVLRSLTNAYSCEHRLVLAPEADPVPLCRLLAQGLVAARPSWDRIMLSGFDPADPAFRPLGLEMRRAGLSVRPYFDSGTWYEETGGLSFAEYLAQRPSELRNTWRRKAAKVGAKGAMHVAYYDTPAGIDDAVADYESVYAESWKPEEGFPRFIPALIRMAAGIGALRMGILHLEGEPAAAQFWILWRGRACIFKLAHRERFASYSVGTVLTMLMVERVLEQDRPTEINFGRGDDPYKKLWLPKRRERWGLAAANPRTPRGLQRSLRHLAAQVVQPLRRRQPQPPL